jgi:limonene-1,2-epoxide hydrolase
MSAATDLIVRLHEDLDRRDFDAATALFHPDARFRNYLDEGEIVGPSAVRAFYQRLFETLAPDIDVLTTTEIPGGRVRAELQVSVHDRSGRLWSDSKVTATYQIVDGRIMAVELADEGR